MLDRDRMLNIAGWTAFALACSAFFLPVINPDIFWHFSAGRYTLAHLGPPRADFLSWPLYGKEWVDFEWLPQVFYYLIYKAGGFTALLFLKALLLALTLLVFRAAALLYGRREALIAALPFFSAAIITNSDLRPENFSLLFFAVTLYFLERTRLYGFPERRLALPTAAFFFALWANLHAGYLYGLALAGLYAAGEFFEEELPCIYGKAPFARPTKSLRYLELFFDGLVSSLANPYGWKIYSVIANHQKYAAVLQEYIQEWNTFDLLNVYQWPYVAALLLVLGSLAFFLLRRKHIRYTHLAALLFFAWASAGHARHIPFFVMTGLVFTLALPWEELRVSGLKRAAAAGLSLVLIFLFYGAYIWPQYTGKATGFRWGSQGLASFLRANKTELSGLRLYNPWGWGGWLGWELGPEYKVFIDGRYLFHDKIEEVSELREGTGKWQALEAKYSFGLALITLDEPKVPVRQKLAGGGETMYWRPAYLFALPRRDWAVVYWDNSVAALARRTAVPAAWLAEHEYRYLRPDDTLNLVEPVLAGDIPLSALRTEMQRYLKNHQAGNEDSLSSGVIRFVREMEKLCARKGSKCAK